MRVEKEFFMYVVILAGGSGTRFWPLSRKRTPKQLLSVFGGKSMLQRTVERTLPLSPKRIIIVTNALQARETAEQLEHLHDVPVDVVVEPVGRNTAPAIGLAASLIAQRDPRGTMVVLPADHYIRDEEEFCRNVWTARESALNGYLVTLGITPDRPETGYGYIEADREGRGGAPYPVSRFVEKPRLEKALEFLAAGNFYWNSGMFVWQAQVILDRIHQYMPALSTSLGKLRFSCDIWDLADMRPQIDALYAEIDSQSIDFGVMEKADNVLVVPVSFGWSDVGSWSAMQDVCEQDEHGNVFLDAPNPVVIDSCGCTVYGAGKQVALVGVRDLIAVETVDAVLVCHRDRAQDVKTVVELLERRGRQELL
jgi:mannose-1-phosphate guanylyltransferase